MADACNPSNSGSRDRHVKAWKHQARLGTIGICMQRLDAEIQPIFYLHSLYFVCLFLLLKNYFTV